MPRTINVHVTEAGANGAVFQDAASDFARIADRLGESGHAVHLSVQTAADDEPEQHPERDALLHLVDTWRNDAAAIPNASRTGTAGQMQRDQILHCADELLRLVATLSL